MSRFRGRDEVEELGIRSAPVRSFSPCSFGSAAELYAYNLRTRAMWSTSYRDAALVEPLSTIMERTWFALLARAVEVLAAGRGARGQRRERVLGALRLAGRLADLAHPYRARACRPQR